MTFSVWKTYFVISRGLLGEWLSQFKLRFLLYFFSRSCLVNNGHKWKITITSSARHYWTCQCVHFLYSASTPALAISDLQRQERFCCICVCVICMARRCVCVPCVYDLLSECYCLCMSIRLQ